MKPVKLIFLFALIISCSPDGKQDIETIDLGAAFNNKKDITLANIATNWDYIRLETNDSCLIGPGSRLYATGENLISIDRSQILLFERSTGKFIRKIGSLGNGPDTYSRTYSVMPVNEDKNTVYAGKNKSRYEYSLTGELVSSTNIPELVSEIGDIDDNTHAAFVPNYMGDEKKKLVIFDSNDSILRIFPNYLTSPKTNGISVFNPHSWFFRENNQLLFYELFNDTIFHVTANSLTPRYILSLGTYTAPYEANTVPGFDLSESFFIRNITGSPGYLFITFMLETDIYTAVYDKEKKAITVNDFVTDSGNGFVNSTDNFVPYEISSVNKSNELVCTVDPQRITNWVTENPDKVSHLSEDTKFMAGISLTDNPVVVIAKLKQIF